MLTRSTFEMKNRRESYEKETKKEIMSKCIGGEKAEITKKEKLHCKWRNWGGIKEYEENYGKKKWRRVCKKR